MYKRLKVVSLEFEESENDYYNVTLQEVKSGTELVVPVGVTEGQAILRGLEGRKALRPQTLDLMRHTLDALRVELEEVVITRLEEGIYYSEMVLLRPEGFREILDCRTSDALALAVSRKAPIFINPDVLDQIQTPKRKKKAKKSKSFRGKKKKTVQELEPLLDLAVQQEDYEAAARLRDEIWEELKHELKIRVLS